MDLEDKSKLTKRWSLVINFDSCLFVGCGDIASWALPITRLKMVMRWGRSAVRLGEKR